jgi:uncharacterized protein DUF6085
MTFQVAGFCPMGCGECLVLGEGGLVTCASRKCPRPSAAAELLRDAEAEHVVQVTWEGFTLRHPLRERLDDALMTCRLHEYLCDPVAPLPPGRYRVSRAAGGPPPAWAFESLP